MIDLHRGDCLRIMPTVPDGSVDMILADLPYGITDNTWDVAIPMEPLWREYLRVAKTNAAIVLFACTPFDKDLAWSQRRLFRYEWIWQKEHPSNFLNARKMPMRAHENVLVFYRRLPTYNPQFGVGGPYRVKGGNRRSENYGKHRVVAAINNGTRYPTTLVRFHRDRRPSVRGKHPTQKPVDLLRYLIRTYSNAGETVLDNCMGSGSTGVAAALEGRRFVGIEKDRKYFATARRRIDEAIESLRSAA